MTRSGRMVRVPFALYELIRFAALTRFRFSAPYWRWRIETALGPDHAKHRTDPDAILDYGLWIRRMRKIAANRAETTRRGALTPIR